MEKRRKAGEREGMHGRKRDVTFSVEEEKKIGESRDR